MNRAAFLCTAPLSLISALFSCGLIASVASAGSIPPNLSETQINTLLAGEATVNVLSSLLVLDIPPPFQVTANVKTSVSTNFQAPAPTLDVISSFQTNEGLPPTGAILSVSEFGTVGPDGSTNLVANNLGTWTGNIRPSGWSLTFSGTLMGSTTRIQQIGLLLAEDAAFWTNSGSIGSAAGSAAGLGSIEFDDVGMLTFDPTLREVLVTTAKILGLVALAGAQAYACVETPLCSEAIGISDEILDRVSGGGVTADPEPASLLVFLPAVLLLLLLRLRQRWRTIPTTYHGGSLVV
jgi:hypothetical protein